MSVIIEKQVTLDLLDIPQPALSATSDIPVIETKPDSSPAPKEEVKPETEAKPEAKEEVPAAKPPEAEKAAESASAEQPEDSSAEPEPKKAKGVQKRIDELTRQREDEKRRAEAAEARLDRALAALEKQQAPKEVKEEPARPAKDPNNPEAYEADLEKYVTELASHIAEKEVTARLAEEDRKRTELSVSEQYKAVREAHSNRVTKAKEKYSDFSEVAESPDVNVSIPMAVAITNSEQGPEIQYYLGKNPAEAERISSMTLRAPNGDVVPDVSRQLVELGMIVAKLNTPPPPPKPLSAAPTPAKPINASSETKPTPEEDSREAYAARRKKEMNERGRPGMRH